MGWVARPKGWWWAEIQPLNTRPHLLSTPKMPPKGPGLRECRIVSCKVILEPDYGPAACPACLKKDRRSKKRRREENASLANTSDLPPTHKPNPVATSSLRSPLASRTFNVEGPSAHPDISTTEENPPFKRPKVSTQWCPLPFSAE
jgi:hypothetical protein